MIKPTEQASKDLVKSRGESFIKLWDFMVYDFGLKNSELIVYAVIFAMHRNYCECFSGSREYLAAWSGASKATVDKTLASLEKKELITKEYRQYGCMRKAVYYINTDALPTCDMFDLENRNRNNKKRINQAQRNCV